MSDATAEIAPDDASAAGTALLDEFRQSADISGLRYVTDTCAGYTRKATRYGFRYLDTTGQPIKSKAQLTRIKSLAIPPVWTDVWICPDAEGHLQATGRDARGRKQYRYHKNWREVRDEAKYERMIGFAMQLPAIRARLEEDIHRPGLSREKVLATIIHLLDVTMIRIGNEARLARIVRRMRELPGQELFQYVDKEGERHSIGSADVNGYLKVITGENYTAKDFRTWSGTVQAVIALKALGPSESVTEAKKKIREAIELTAKKLGNTPTICRKCYVHPAVLEAYANGAFDAVLAKKGSGELQTPYDGEEAFTLELLQQKLKRATV